MSSRVHSDETIATARRYWDAGLAVTEIGYKMGVSKGVITGISYRNNFPARKPTGGYCRPVITANGKRYPSIRAAARAHGITYAAGWERVTNGWKGWRFADE